MVNLPILKIWLSKLILTLSFFLFLLISATPLFSQVLQSPDQQVNLQFFLGPKGEPTYTLQRKGKADQAAGKVKKAVDKVKHKAEDAIDHLKDALS